MYIKLELINPSPNPVRKSWDEDKMNELAQSIKEQGVIVPVKVRPANEKTESYAAAVEKWGEGFATDEKLNAWQALFMDTAIETDDGDFYSPDEQWEIVYGHRRVEAARRAGLDEIECIVEGVDDESAIWQAIIENVCREDMTQFDEGRAYKLLKEDYGLPVYEISNKVGKSHGWINRCIALVNDPISATLIEQPAVGSPADVAEITREPLKNDLKAREAVIKKMAKEGLTRDQTRKVAESIAVTKDPRRRDALLNTPYSSFIHDPEINKERAEKYGAADPLSNSKEPTAGAVFEMALEVKMIIDYLRTSRKQMVSEVRKMYEVGKFSPEAVPFVMREARMMVEAWQKLIDDLED